MHNSKRYPSKIAVTQVLVYTRREIDPCGVQCELSIGVEKCWTFEDFELIDQRTLCFEVKTV